MKTLNYLIILSSILIVSCSQGEKRAKTAQEAIKQQQESGVTAYKPLSLNPEKQIDVEFNDQTKALIIAKGKDLAARMQNNFQVAMRNAIKNGGMVSAIGFCNEEAMKISDSASVAENAVIQRIALKYRNRNNRMNEQDQKIYKDFVISWMAKAPMKPKVQLSADRHPVYYAPITMKPICLNCHGNPEKDINPDVAAKIAELYPNDKAINFKAVDMRGMWKITFAEYNVK